MSENIQMKKSVSKKDALRKKRRKIRKRIFLFLLFITVCAGIVYFAMSPFFNVKNVELKGKTRYNKDEIFNASGLILSENGFKSIGGDIKSYILLRNKHAEDNIQKLFPYIDTAEVSFRIPSSFVIEVTERLPFMLFKYHDSYLILDKTGYILDIVDEKKKPKLPEFTAKVTETIKPGVFLKTKPQEAFTKISSLIEQIKDKDVNETFKISQNITYLKCDEKGNVYIDLNNKLLVNLGDMKNLSYRIDFLRNIYLTGLRKDETGLLDFTLEDNPVLQPLTR